MKPFELYADLKQSIRRGRPTLGLFIKTPAMQIVESLARTGLDFVALDAEHAAFGAADLDRCILAGRAVGLPVLVRLREATPAAILEVLDLGAAGIIVPHVQSAGRARDIVAATRYQGGTRGFSGMHRAAAYGAIAAADFKRLSDASGIVIAQLEDAAGLDEVEAIAAIDALDALFIGRADLAVSLGAASISDEVVTKAVDRIIAACNQNTRSVGAFLPSVEEASAFGEKGVSLFVISTDQALLVEAATSLAGQFKGFAGDTAP